MRDRLGLWGEIMAVCHTSEEQALWDQAFVQARAAGKLWYEAVRAADARLRAHRESQTGQDS